MERCYALNQMIGNGSERDRQQVSANELSDVSRLSVWMEAMDCSAAFLSMLLGYYRAIVPLAKLCRVYGMSRDGRWVLGITCQETPYLSLSQPPCCAFLSPAASFSQ